MTYLLTLASELTGEKTWWNPYLKGAVITVLALGLFVGAAYLLLYTNVGSRLGFLLTAAAATGFVAVLAVFWITAQFVTGPKGDLPGWPVEEIADDLGEARTAEVRDMAAEGNIADPAEAGQIRAELEQQLTAAESPHKSFSEPAEFLTVTTYTEGGGRKWPWFWSEKTTYGVSEICPTAEPEVLPLEAPPTPECDPEAGRQFVVVVKDLGSQRLPQFFFFGFSIILFALSLYALNRYEKEVEGIPGPEGKAGPEGNGDGPSGDGAPEGSPAEPEPATA